MEVDTTTLATKVDHQAINNMRKTDNIKVHHGGITNILQITMEIHTRSRMIINIMALLGIETNIHKITIDFHGSILK